MKRLCGTSLLRDNRVVRDNAVSLVWRRIGRAGFVGAVLVAFSSASSSEETAGVLAPHEAFYSCMSSRKEEGVAACRQALLLPLGPERRSVAQGVLALHLANLARWNEAADAYQKLVQLRPEDAEAHLRLADTILFGLGRPWDALLPLRKSLILRPDSVSAFGSLGFALARIGRHEEAVEAFREAQRLDSDFWKNRPGARAAYESAQRGDPWPPPERPFN
ncbi:MAG: tetratricopeptide repeat protein [Vicinamibacteria bacterium]|nr:tetratricopeptide repeat protein [Vicinamibacteria bacterium]